MRKRKLLALLLALVVCMGQLPIIARGALVQSDTRAYLEALWKHPDCISYLIDFDGDGRDELLLAWLSDEFGGVTREVWQGSACVSESEVTYRDPLSLCFRNGKYYLYSGSHAGVMESWESFDTLELGQWVQETHIYQGYDYSTETQTLSITSDLAWPEGTTVQDILNAYQEEIDFKSVLSSGNRTASDSVLEQLLSTGFSAEPKDALSQIAYIGDRSQCKMDAQMAQAYADVLRGLLREEVPDFPIKWGALLLDPAQDGYPLLLTSPYNHTSNCELWYYDGAKARSFTEISPFVQWGGNLSIGTSNRGAVLKDKGCTLMTSKCFFYSVSKGNLQLLDGRLYHDEWGYDRPAYGVNSDKEVWAFERDFDWTTTQEVSYFIYNGEGEPAVMGFTTDPTPVATVISALEAYASAAPASPYPNLEPVEADGDNYDAIIAAALEGIEGEVLGVYKLSEDLYVVVILVGEVQQAALVHGVKQNGKPVWRSDAPFAQLPTEEELGQLSASAATRPNVSLDYGKLPSLTDSAALSDYLKGQLSNMEGLTVNDPAKTELAAFLESALANQAVGTLSGKDNRVTVDGEAVSALVQEAQKTRQEMEALLREQEITLNKPLVLIIRLFWQNTDWSQPCQMELDQALADALQDCSAQLLLGDDRHYLQFSAQQLQALLGAHGSLSVQFSRTEEGAYDIRFLDGEGNVIEQLSVPVTVGLPAGSMTSTVMASYAGGSDNWGGQYDQNAGTLSFETRFSGRYEVLENDLTVGDIDGLSEESRQAIRFLVSKGFLTLEGESFRPGDSLTRYEFTQALVGMFFALDRSLTADFPDVPADSPYYPYVASAQHDGIVNGYSDGTFSGEDPITREQVLALAARTLMERKGYTLPQDVEAYLSGFADRQDISAWAETQVALAVREGVASRGSVLLPQNNITREQAAVILYRLFLLLYEVRPVALELPQTTPAEGGAGQAVSAGTVAAAVVTVAAAGGGAGGWLLLRKKKVPGVKREPSPSGKKD